MAMRASRIVRSIHLNPVGASVKTQIANKATILNRICAESI